MKIGLYGGSFDPVHYGHLNLVIELAERHHLDKVYIVPTAKSPGKRSPVALDSDRLAMVQAAFLPLSFCEVIPWEIERGGQSYTVDTLRALRKIHPEDQIFLLMGGDAYASFFEWRDPHEILKMATLLVAQRKSLLPQKEGVAITEVPLFDISSTQIRERFRQKRYCGHLVPPEVLDYIHNHSLYL